jgi:hypothetical protein
LFHPLPNEVSIPSLYVGIGCPKEAKKTADFAMVTSLHPGKNAFQTRRNICHWLGLGNYILFLGVEEAINAKISVEVVSTRP